eukprot:13777434-Ditylum_brightwellii.AAC.1
MVHYLENCYTHGICALPKTMGEMYSCIANYILEPKAYTVGTNSQGAAFLTSGDEDQNNFPCIK